MAGLFGSIANAISVHVLGITGGPKTTAIAPGKLKGLAKRALKLTGAGELCRTEAVNRETSSADQLPMKAPSLEPALSGRKNSSWARNDMVEPASISANDRVVLYITAAICTTTGIPSNGISINISPISIVIIKSFSERRHSLDLNKI